MARIGRNTPCPCGSGKKYKKCCLGTQRDPARSGATPARTGHGPATRAAVHELADALDHVVTEAPWLLSEVCADLDLSPRRVAETVGLVAMLGMCLAAPGLIPDRSELDRLVRARLTTQPARQLHAALCAAPTKLYELRRERSRTLARPALGPTSPFRPMALMLRPDAEETDYCVGTVARLTAGPLLLAWEFLDELEVDEVTYRAQEEGPRGARSELDFWDWMAPILADVVLDPDGLLGAYETLPFGRAWAPVHESVADDLESATQEPLHIRTAERDYAIAWVRETLASADPEALRRLIDAIAACVSYWKTRSMDTTTEGDPIELTLACFGADRAGHVTGVDEDAVRRQPYALLLLDSDHPMHVALPRWAPINAALGWADAQGAGKRASEVRDAWQTYQVELRWLATYTDEHRPSARRLWEHRQHAICELFHPGCGDARLSDLGMKRDAIRRLLKALDTLGVPDPQQARVRDLPPVHWELVQCAGYGVGSHNELLRCLTEHIRSWRARAAGVDLDELAKRSEAAETNPTLAEGLDELAKLFGD